MIKITADSTCDLSENLLKEMDITLLPLCVFVDETEYRDGADMKTAQLLQHMKEGKACRTAAVNLYDYIETFETFLKRYEAVIHIALGSKFSSCYQNAQLAAHNFDHVYVVDSQNLSTGSGHLVYDAACMAKKGVDAEEICMRLNQMVRFVDASFVVDSVDALYKGGRCSGLEAIGSKLLKIKPCIEVVDGSMKVGKKYKGSLERCLKRYVADRLEQPSIDYSRIFITHSLCPKPIIDEVREHIQQHADFEEIIETQAGCTIASHCGPNTLGILFKHKLVFN